MSCLAWHRNISSNRVSTNIVFCFSFLLHKFSPPFLAIPSGHRRMRRLWEAFILNLERWELSEHRPGLLMISVLLNPFILASTPLLMCWLLFFLCVKFSFFLCNLIPLLVVLVQPVPVLSACFVFWHICDYRKSIFFCFCRKFLYNCTGFSASSRLLLAKTTFRMKVSHYCWTL